MQPIQTPVTGNEELSECETADCAKREALRQFYKAFNQRDFALMQENWLNDSTIAMDNPLGGIKRGWGEIKEVYERIFKGQAKVYVEFYEYTIIDFEDGFCAVGRERGYVRIAEKRLELAIRTSRVYKWVEGAYKQVHHHGSIESPELLKKYQELVK